MAVEHPADNAAIAARFAQAAHLALISIDGVGRIEFANPSAAALFGYAIEEMIGSDITIIIPERMRGPHTSGLARVAAGASPNLAGKTVEVSARKRDGSEFPIEITLCIWHDESGMRAGAVIKDISERRERDSRLLRLASQDTLTGLPNKHRFVDLLKAELAADRPASIILLDLDGFKEVNEMHGHIVGDSLLQAIAVRIPYLLRSDAEFARFGSDEFAVLLPGIGDPLAVEAEISAILQALATPFALDGHVLQLSACAGFAVSPAHGRDEEELIASADFALHSAKATGRQVCRMFEHGMRSETLARRSLRDELLIALRTNQLVLHYQPQVSIKTGRIFGAEALIRWQHPQRGLLAPGAFLPALEQSSLALEIGWWTLEQACLEAVRLRDLDRSEIKISVNLFPIQLRVPQFAKRVLELILSHGLDPRSIELEVTETIALNDNDKSLEVLTELREMGIGIAFDDFGTGYASLSSLQKYPLTTLKIDRGFIQNILTDAGDAAITRALLFMAKELGLQTIVEGVETKEQEAALVALGCRAAQGYLYGKPAPASALEQALKDERDTGSARNDLVQEGSGSSSEAPFRQRRRRLR